MDRINGHTERVRVLAATAREIAALHLGPQNARALESWVSEEVHALTREAWDDGWKSGYAHVPAVNPSQPR